MVTPAHSHRRFLAPGDQLGKHAVIRPIAAGGMAELYLTRTVGIEGFEKLVCVKRILPQYSGNPKFVNMFLKEARLAATLHHPNIAQVYDIGQDKGEYFFSMEYVHGEDLGRIVSAGRENGVPISLDCSLTLVAGLCAGLHYAHDKAAPDGKPLGVVHRDVSPTNVLVSYDGAVKLVDFGIARAGESSTTSQTGGLKGKISYMSPEQCRGKAALDRRSDVFSVGTILYELTTGRLPFVADTEYGVLHQVVNRDADPPSTLVPNYPPALEAIVMRALARDPGRRFSTALELQHQLEDFAHDNRLRVSPLVLARLMSTLFPARLEEWDHARAQGAFFVEQHVVRTLIEDGKTADGAARYQTPGIDREDGGSKAVAPTSPEGDSSERTEIGPEPQMPPMSPMLHARPATPPPVPHARPSAPLPSVRPATPVPSMRPATPVPSLRPATPVPSSPATVPPASGAHASGVQSPASRPPAAPNPPAPVPIVGGLSGPPIPSGGTLVSSATQTGKPPPPAVPTPAPYGPPGGMGGFTGASGGTLVSSATQVGNSSSPVPVMPPSPYAVPGSPGGFMGASGGTLVSSATQVGNSSPPVMPQPMMPSPYAAPGSANGFAGPSGPGGPGSPSTPGGVVGGAGVAQERSSFPVGDVTDRVRVSPARPTLVIRRRARSRLPLVGLAVVAAAGAMVLVWLAVIRNGDPGSPEGQPPASARNTPANSGSAGPAKSSAPPAAQSAAASAVAPASAPAAADSMRAADTAAESGKVSAPAAEPTPTAGPAAEPTPVGGAAPAPVNVAQPAVESTPPGAGSAAAPVKVAQPAAAPASPSASGELSGAAKPDPAKKKAKPSRPKRTESKRTPKAEPKDQPWNDDSPFMPVPTSKR